MKNFALLFLVFAVIVAVMPFVADATIEKSDVLTVSVCFSDGRIENIELEDYVLRVLAAREDEVSLLPRQVPKGLESYCPLSGSCRLELGLLPACRGAPRRSCS